MLYSCFGGWLAATATVAVAVEIRLVVLLKSVEWMWCGAVLYNAQHVDVP